MSIWRNRSGRAVRGLLLIPFFFATFGCGSNAPIQPPNPPIPSPQPGGFIYVRTVELNAYLQALDPTIPDFRAIIQEHNAVLGDWSDGRTNPYWTQIFANNVILRIQAYSLRLNGIRPNNPELRDIHDQFSLAIQTLEGGMEVFRVAIGPEDSRLLGQAFEDFVRVNDLLDTVTARLSNLSGQPIRFF